MGRHRDQSLASSQSNRPSTNDDNSGKWVWIKKKKIKKLHKGTRRVGADLTCIPNHTICVVLVAKESRCMELCMCVYVCWAKAGADEDDGNVFFSKQERLLNPSLLEQEA